MVVCSMNVRTFPWRRNFRPGLGFHASSWHAFTMSPVRRGDDASSRPGVSSGSSGTVGLLDMSLNRLSSIITSRMPGGAAAPGSSTSGLPLSSLEGASGAGGDGLPLGSAPPPPSPAPSVQVSLNPHSPLLHAAKQKPNERSEGNDNSRWLTLNFFFLNFFFLVLVLLQFTVQLGGGRAPTASVSTTGHGGDRSPSRGAGARFATEGAPPPLPPPQTTGMNFSENFPAGGPSTSYRRPSHHNHIHHNHYHRTSHGALAAGKKTTLATHSNNYSPSPSPLPSLFRQETFVDQE